MNTPRTDAETFHQEWDCRRPAKDGACVDADFARKLESELAETKTMLAYKNDTANTFMGQVKKLQSELEKEWIKNGELREQIERLKDNQHPCRICGQQRGRIKA